VGSFNFILRATNGRHYNTDIFLCFSCHHSVTS
jgi:hypothetical protein